MLVACAGQPADSVASAPSPTLAATTTPAVIPTPDGPFPHPIPGWDDIDGKYLFPNVKLLRSSAVYDHIDLKKLLAWVKKFELEKSRYFFTICVACDTGNADAGRTMKWFYNGTGEHPLGFTGLISLTCAPNAVKEPGGMWACIVHEMVHARARGLDQESTEAEAYSLDSAVVAWTNGCQTYSCYTSTFDSYAAMYPSITMMPLSEGQYEEIQAWIVEIGSFMKP